MGCILGKPNVAVSRQSTSYVLDVQRPRNGYRLLTLRQTITHSLSIYLCSADILQQIEVSIPRIHPQNLPDEDIEVFADEVATPSAEECPVNDADGEKDFVHCTATDGGGFDHGEAMSILDKPAEEIQPDPLAAPTLRSVKETFSLKVGVLEGTTFLNDYVVVDTLGRGSHGKVKLCLNVVDNHLYAVKIVETAAMSKHEKSRLARNSVNVGDTSRLTQLSKKSGEPGRGATSDALDHTVSSSALTLSAASRRRLQSVSGTNLQAMEMEADVMKALNHPNLVRLYEVIRSDNSGKLLMVMEYCHAGPLVDEKGRFSHYQEDIPEIIVHHFFKQITSAIQYLHSEGIVHGDIKPENMLLSGDGTVKISDFGQSLRIMRNDSYHNGPGEKTSMLTRTLGTPAYLSPEICAGEEYDGFAADMWALGVTLFFFMFGKLPFEGSTVVDLYDNIAEEEVSFPEGQALSIELQDLFLRLLNKNPNYRITADELVVHPWVVSEDLEEVEHMFEDDQFLPEEFRVTRTSYDGTFDGTVSNKAALTSEMSSGTQMEHMLSKQSDSMTETYKEELCASTILNSLSMSSRDGRATDAETFNNVRDTSLEEFNTIADNLLKSQKSMMERMYSGEGPGNRSWRTSQSPKMTQSLLSIQESKSMDFGRVSGGSRSDNVRQGPPSTNRISLRPAELVHEESSQIHQSPFESPSNSQSVLDGLKDVLHTSDEVNGAALMHFKAGELIDDFHHENHQFAYYIDVGDVSIRYMADLPVSFEEIVENCLEDVIASQYSADFAHADSVCYTENASKFVFQQRSKGPTFLSPLHYLQSTLEKLRPRDASEKPIAVNDEDIGSVHLLVKRSEEAMNSISKGAVGDLLCSVRHEGSFVGALNLLDPEYFQNKWKFSAVALTDVTIIKMTKEALGTFLMVHPLSQVMLRASMSLTVSELVKLEIYERVSLARRKMSPGIAKPSMHFSTSSSSSSGFSAVANGFEEVARHITDTAVAGAEVLAKLDIFALASKLRDEAQISLGIKSSKKDPSTYVASYEI
jgi:[calcium/calmodulin-dependent protein kinase] kinase